MGFYINEEIETKLHFEDVSIINMVFQDYKERFKDIMDKEVLERMNNLSYRLTKELYNTPENDTPNGH